MAHHSDLRHRATRVTDLEELIWLIRKYCPHGSVVEGTEALMLVDEIDRLRALVRRARFFDMTDIEP